MELLGRVSSSSSSSFFFLFSFFFEKGLEKKRLKSRVFSVEARGHGFHCAKPGGQVRILPVTSEATRRSRHARVQTATLRVHAGSSGPSLRAGQWSTRSSAPKESNGVRAPTKTGKKNSHGLLQRERLTKVLGRSTRYLTLETVLEVTKRVEKRETENESVGRSTSINSVLLKSIM